MKYTEEQIKQALALYHQCKSPTQVKRQLGYPSRPGLQKWLAAEGKPKPPRKPYDPNKHPEGTPLEVKLCAIHRCYDLGERVQLVADEIGYSCSAIKHWIEVYKDKGMKALMESEEKRRRSLAKKKEAPPTEIEELRKQMLQMQLQIDILNETLNILKKDPGIDTKTLRNKEKAVIVDALKSKYSLPLLLTALNMPKSSYYYRMKNGRADKYADLRNRIIRFYHEGKECYGYRRIYGCLKNVGVRISEKVIRRIMKEEGLYVKTCKHARFNSYRGEITPAPPNLIVRDFHANKPNEKWLTDITEFALPVGKIYLSPIIDCFDGMIVSWSIGNSANAELANSMLDKASNSIQEFEHPIIHSDRGGHYRWPKWIEKVKKAGMTRSMSQKGCSPDNAACEGFFGRIKNEMFYNRDWRGVSIEEFKSILNDYLLWYNEKRIKISLNYMSPVEYRRSLGLII